MRRPGSPGLFAMVIYEKIAEMTTLDFTTPAAVYVQIPGAFRSMRGRAPQKYRRFESLALAVQFAVEKSLAELRTLMIETDDGDYTGAEIQSLYDHNNYPLRKAAD